MKYLALLLVSVFVLFAGFSLVSSNRSMRTVLGVSTSAYRSATISWKSVAGASGYNIYYKQQSDKGYMHSVRGISASSISYTINYLKKDQSYQYIIKAFSSSGNEFWSSPQLSIWKLK